MKTPAKRTTAGLPPRRSSQGPRAARRMAEILAAGREVFSLRGFEAATTTEIAERLGISEATIFTYFRSKRDLCLGVIEAWYQEITEQVAAGMPRKAPLRIQFAYLVESHLRLFLVQGTGMCALVLSEGRTRGQPLGHELAPLQRKYTAPLMALLAAGRASGELRTDLPLRLMRSLVYGPMEHILWEAIDSRKSVDVDATAEELTRVLWAALRRPDAELAALRHLRKTIIATLDESV